LPGHHIACCYRAKNSKRLKYGQNNQNAHVGHQRNFYKHKISNITNQSIDSGNYLKVRFGRNLIRCLLDTGASISLVSSAFVDSLNLAVDPLQSNDKTCFYAANGSRMHVVGTINLYFKVSGLTLNHDFYVVDNLADSVLLATDFFMKNNCILDFSKQIISILGDLIRAPLYSNKNKESYARTANSVFIKPYSEAVFPVRCSRPFYGRDVKVEPIPGQQFVKYAVARSIGTVRGGITLCRILNYRPEAIFLPKNSKVATISTVNVEQEFQPWKIPSQSKTPEIQISDEQLEKFAVEYGFTINPELIADQRKELLSLHHKYRDVFAQTVQELKRCPNYELKLTLKPDAKPRYQRQYKLSERDAIECHNQIMEFKNAGLIQPSKNSLYNTAIFLIDKKDKMANNKRVLLDFRHLNANIQNFNLELPQMHDILNSLASSQANYYTTTDLKSSYYQVGLHPDSRHITAFSDPLTRQRYEWCVAPMGLAPSASAAVIAIMECLGSLMAQSYCYCYVDDVCIVAKDWNTHQYRLELLLQTLKENQLSLNPKKSTFAVSKITYLGYEISKDGLKIDKNRVKAIQCLQIPKDKKGLQRILGIFNFMRRYIPNFAKQTYHMRQNLNKDTIFNFDQNCIDEFNHIKDHLSSDQVLKPIDGNKPFYIYSDASYQGIGAGIFQPYEGKLYPVGYVSKSLTPAQRSYTVMEIEI
jgi:hypothetical protein